MVDGCKSGGEGDEPERGVCVWNVTGTTAETPFMVLSWPVATVTSLPACTSLCLSCFLHNYLPQRV